MKIQLLKSKKTVIVGVVLTILATIILVQIFFKDNTYKKSNKGNNNNENITLENVDEYILNINYYKANIEVTVNSNKNSNKYIIEQIHSSNSDYQKILEPANLAGVEIIYKENTLEIKNTALNLSKIYNDYPYIEDNSLWLNSFITQYKETKNKKTSKEENEIIITLNSTSQIKELHINYETGNPTKLLIMDNNKKTNIYIIYNEITLNDK